MNLQLVEEGIFDAVQQQRIMKDMAEFRQGDVPYLQYTYCEVKHVSFTAPSSEMENEISLVLTEFANMLDENLPEDEDRIDNHSAALDAVILDRTATHLSVLAEVDFPKVNLEFRLFYHYLDIDPIGPMIEGDIIVQGAMADSHYGPALGVIECDVNGDGNYSEVAYITPSKMMITPGGPTDDFGGADGGDNTTKFLIPITIYKDFQNKPLQIKIYCQRFSEIQYDAVDENITDLTAPEKRHEYFLTNLILPPSNANLPTNAETGETSELKEEGRDHPSHSDEFHNSLVIRGIRVATDYDEVIALQNEGYELCCTLVTPTGTISDQDHIWKFHVLAEFGPPNEPGLEDLMFIKCLKSLGTLPVIPFFEVLHDYDLSKPEDDYSVYIAVKMGMSPKFKKLVMISCAMEHEESLELFITTISGFFRLAPPELDKSMDGHCGLLLSYESVIPDTVPTRRPLTDTPSTPQQPQRKQSVAKMKPDDEQSMPGSEEDEEEEDEDDDVYIDEEERIRQLQQVLYDLEAEKKSLLQSNQELQKKAVTLMTREKALQGQSNPTGTANASRPAQTTEGGTGTGEGGGDPNNPSGTGGGGTGQPEQNIEKEKQYQDVLTLIVEERKKLNKQLKEFDQLALDLQTRLDDKEFKAKSIATSFKQFKKEILQKAENSRTGHQISKAQIQQIENSELKHEEDLEKIRLRNISLKSLQKKLEKTLRQREQLAEGLHMIDFEQLKIENQTLNEKIEERNEELSKLKRKKTLTVQILTHIREKLKYIELQNNLLKQKVNTLETFITTKRNSVTIKKLERDELRIENKEYKAKQGFATSDLLLLDYEKRKYQTQEVEANIMELKNRYDLLTKQLQFTNTSNIFSSSMGEGSGGGGGGGRSIKFGGLLSSSAVRETTSAGGGLGNGGLQVSRGMNANTKPGMMSAGNYKLSR